MNWRAARGCASGECIEAASWGTAAGAVVGVRDSAGAGGLVLAFSADAWQVFTAALKAA